MQVEEIRAMRLHKQHLIIPVSMDVAVRDLCGVQAQFLSNAMHALRIRCHDFDPALAQEQLVKSWTLRGTMHVFAREDLPLMLHKGRTHFLRSCDKLEADECISKERKGFFAELILQRVRGGAVTREELRELCAANGMTETESLSLFDAWGGVIRALCEEGSICHVVREKKAYQLAPAFEPREKETAETELARRYFTHYGPATVRDAAYFFGATQKRVKGWLDRLPVESFQCEGREYFHIPCEQDEAADVPACLFLAGFDPLMLGYEKKDSLFLPAEHLRGIFNLAGIVMPALLLHGRVVGRWKKEKKLNISLFETLDAKQRSEVEQAARRLWGEAEPICFTKM